MDDKQQELVMELIVDVFKMLKSDVSEEEIRSELADNDVPTEWIDFIMEQAYSLGQR